MILILLENKSILENNYRHKSHFSAYESV